MRPLKDAKEIACPSWFGLSTKPGGTRSSPFASPSTSSALRYRYWLDKSGLRARSTSHPRVVIACSRDCTAEHCLEIKVVLKAQSEGDRLLEPLGFAREERRRGDDTRTRPFRLNDTI